MEEVKEVKSRKGQARKHASGSAFWECVVAVAVAVGGPMREGKRCASKASKASKAD